MKLKDIIAATQGKYTQLDFESVWSVDDSGNICMKTPIDINIEDEVEVVYYWYHHMIDKKIRDNIQKAIDTRDYEAFMKYADEDVRCEFLPVSASIYSNGEFIGNVAICQSKEAFGLITHSECECG